MKPKTLSEKEVNILTQVMKIPTDINFENAIITKINIPINELYFIKGFTKEDFNDFIKELKEEFKSADPITKMLFYNTIDKLIG